MTNDRVDSTERVLELRRPQSLSLTHTHTHTHKHTLSAPSYTHTPLSRSVPLSPLSPGSILCPLAPKGAVGLTDKVMSHQCFSLKKRRGGGEGEETKPSSVYANITPHPLSPHNTHTHYTRIHTHIRTHSTHTHTHLRPKVTQYRTSTSAHQPWPSAEPLPPWQPSAGRWERRPVETGFPRHFPVALRRLTACGGWSLQAAAMTPGGGLDPQSLAAAAAALWSPKEAEPTALERIAWMSSRVRPTTSLAAELILWVWCFCVCFSSVLSLSKKALYGQWNNSTDYACSL